MREGLDAGLGFNTGVVYLPPSGVRDGVAELIRVNDGLRKIVIITEKIAVHDAREIRAMAQANGIDIIGGNCLGVADSWNRVRIGGALGGDHPEESLLKGSVAIFSNSGGFTTTIAQYLATAGWGTTTLVSSGKDVYIHYAAPDFAHAFGDDDRSKAAVLYAEPGGYYEHGIDWKKAGRRLRRRPLEVEADPRRRPRRRDGGLGRQCRGQGALVHGGLRRRGPLHAGEPGRLGEGRRRHQHRRHPGGAQRGDGAEPGHRPDFAPRGDLALKPWLANDQALRLPPELAMPVVTAPEPYAGQIAALGSQIGAVVARQNMKDKSGASVMDPTTQVTSVHGHSVLDLALEPLEANFALPLVHEIATENDRAMLDVAVAAEVNLVGDPILVAADAARDAGNAPNAVMATAAAIVGPKRVERALACTRALIDLFAHSGLRDGRDEGFDTSGIRIDAETRALFLATEAEANDPRPEAMLAAIEARGGKSAFLKYLKGLDGRLSRDAILAAIATTIAWGPLDAQAHHPADRRDAALVPAALWGDGRRDDPRRAPPVGLAARHPARGALRPLDHGRPLLPRHERQEADAGGGAAAADPRRPADLERPRLDLGAGRQGRGLGRRPADARAGCRSTRRWSAF